MSYFAVITKKDRAYPIRCQRIICDIALCAFIRASRSYAHRDYGRAHRDTGKCRRLDVCCRQSQLDKQRCFAALSNKKSHALASKLADMAFLFATTSWSLFIYLTLARYYSYSIIEGSLFLRNIPVIPYCHLI